MRDPDLTPLPRWKQHRQALISKWRRGKESRRQAYSILRTLGAKATTLAISVVGATLVSFGVYSIYAPAGYIFAGLLVWLLQWSYEQDKRRHE